ncbi:MAG: S-methyl-5-thioribose-1-phosphate isomerase [Bacteroidetes bacterium]|nr:S-methyl-5-thioribose-1-phosphate isomerase [Bacteroidota bacterium]
MLVNDQHYQTIWLKEGNDKIVQIIDQRFLPHRFVMEDLSSVHDFERAICEMHVRGAGLIGAAAGFAMYVATMEAASKTSFDESVFQSSVLLKKTRPTAVNLEWAINRQLEAIATGKEINEKISLAKKTALAIATEDAAGCHRIGLHGIDIIEEISRKKNGDTVNILTHCNAGWLAFVDYGTATAPIYEAHKRGINIHVWVDETRPRNQGANLTSWELLNEQVPHTVIADNTGGHLMQHGLVDMVITGADRLTRNCDAANKIGTYLKALAAKDNNIPFYIALPSSTIDWSMRDGIKEINIEERDPDEVKYVHGLCDGEWKKVLITPAEAKAANYGFDVTPARLISGIITERGICAASDKGLLELYPEMKL